MLFLLLILLLTCPTNLLANSPDDVTITDFSSNNSDIEWVQITNNTNHDIDLTDWVLRDEVNENDNTDGIILTGCLSPNTFEIFTHGPRWLNNDNDTIFLYDQNDQLINSFPYTQGREKEAPVTDNICVLDSPTPSPSPTSDNITLNPDSNISLNEIMPYSSIEWIEIYNHNNFDVKLVDWTIEDNISNSKNIPDLVIEANSLAIFEFSSLLNNDQSDALNLYNQNHNLVDNYAYPSDNFDLTKSWSKIDGSWCKTNTSKGSSNNTCFSPTLTPTPSPTITPSPTKIPTLTPTPKKTNTPSPDINSDEEYLFEQDSEKQQNNKKELNGSVLGQGHNQSKDKKNYFPLILIISGGLLLLSPLIVTTLKKWKSNSKK